MAIKTGRYGRVRWNPLGVTSPAALVVVASLNTWKLSLKQDFEDVTCWPDTNKQYVPGMMDVSGSLGGFFNVTELAVIAAAHSETPGLLELTHNTADTVGSPLAAATFSGLAYLDADIDCSMSAPKLSASFRAAGNWTLPA